MVDISRVLILDYRTYQTDIYKVPITQDSVNTESFLPHNKNVVTFKKVQNLLESQPDYSSSQYSEMLQWVKGYLNNSNDNPSPKPKSSYSDSKNEDGFCWLF